jgi:hypothetical protein
LKGTPGYSNARQTDSHDNLPFRDNIHQTGICRTVREDAWVIRLVKIAVAVAAALIIVLVAVSLWLTYQTATVKGDLSQFNVFLEQGAVRPEYVATSREPCLDNNPLRNPYFGALHIHTSLSGDASAWGVTATPADAYRFARGQSLDIRLRGELAGDEVPVIALDRPLDFAAVTDHAEYLGEASLCLTTGSSAYATLLCKVYRRDIELPIDEHLRPMVSLASFVLFKNRSRRICGEDGIACIKEAASIWKEHQRAAEAAYDRSEDCSFTSFVGYEYSLARDGANLHRNVIFANAAVPPSPLSAREAKEPELLWDWLQRTCKDSEAGCDVLTIPHNSNWSSGRMFYPYALSTNSGEEKRRLAALRSEMEPLAEIMQVKGDSECRNRMYRVIGEPDELCDFEKLRLPEDTAEDCLDTYGSKGMQLAGCLSRWSFVRYGLMEGLREEKLLGANTFKLGIIAATDNHIGAGGAVAESKFPGSIGLDRYPKDRMRDPLEIPGVAKADATRFNPGGIAGIWARENSRESLFAAMQRRETFGTSGPRILPRLFAGWDYTADLCNATDMLDQAYARGVPMGGDLPPATDNNARPTFLVSATMDSLAEATELQKIQIIKGWIDDQGNMHQQIIDVVGDDEPRGSVDPENCVRSGAGHTALCGVWQDDDFEPGQSAVYYARVVENPSCRWTTYDCNSLPQSERPAACTSETLPKVIQERAWTSPVWYSVP